jgi:hypothetical protein
MAKEKLEHLPYEQLVKKVEEAGKLYEHKITIRKRYNQGSDTSSFDIYLLLYRRTSEHITAVEDIWESVKFGVCENFNINDSGNGYCVPISWAMNNSGVITILTLTTDGGVDSSIYPPGDYTITDTVT